MRTNFYAWIIDLVVSAMGAFNFIHYLVLILVLLNGIEDFGLTLSVYAIPAVYSTAIFVYLIIATIRKSFGLFPFGLKFHVSLTAF